MQICSLGNPLRGRVPAHRIRRDEERNLQPHVLFLHRPRRRELGQVELVVVEVVVEHRLRRDVVGTTDIVHGQLSEARVGGIRVDIKRNVVQCHTPVATRSAVVVFRKSAQV